MVKYEIPDTAKDPSPGVSFNQGLINTYGFCRSSPINISFEAMPTISLLLSNLQSNESLTACDDNYVPLPRAKASFFASPSSLRSSP